jgi:hypothetical protein
LWWVQPPDFGRLSVALWVYSTTGPGVVNLAARILDSTAGRWTRKNALIFGESQR